jgi:hypothetical protein
MMSLSYFFLYEKRDGIPELENPYLVINNLMKKKKNLPMFFESNLPEIIYCENNFKEISEISI